MSNLGSQIYMSNIKRKKLRKVKFYKDKKKIVQLKPEEGQ